MPVVLNLEAGRWGVGHPGEADHDDLAVPERREDVGVGAGEGEGLHGQLQRHGGHGVQAEHVAQHQVPVLVPGQQPVVTRQQTCQQTSDIETYFAIILHLMVVSIRNGHSM